MMSHILLTGTAGTGKSHVCLQRYLSAGENSHFSGILFLLPSRNTAMILEKDIAKALDCCGVVSQGLVTFTDLAKGIVREAGEAMPEIISPNQKLLVLDEIVSKARLRFFSGSARYPGFVRMLREFFKELGENQYSQDDLETALQKLNSSARKDSSLPVKGREIHLLYDMYRKKLDKLGLLDEELLLGKSLDLLRSRKGIFSSIKLLLVDGFSQYSRVQLKILKQLLKRIPEAVVTLCYRKDDPERFRFVDNTYERLMEISSWRKETLKQNRRAHREELHHLDERLFAPDVSIIPAAGAVRMLRGESMYDEIEKIASEVLHLHLDEGVPFGEIGVLLRSVNEYGDVFEDRFRNCGIPYSIQGRRTQLLSSSTELIAGICDLILGELTTEKTLMVMKHGLLGLDYATINRVEEYVLANGIADEKDWRTEWPSDITEIKDGFIEKIDYLRVKATEATFAEQHADLMMDIFRKFEIVEGIVRAGDSVMESFDEAMLSSAGSGVETVHSACREVVDYCRLSGGKKVDFNSFVKMLNLAVRNSLTHTLPRTNSVQISDIFEARSPEYRVVFLPGLVEKKFPRQVRNGPFLKDRERSLLRSKEFDLPPKLRYASGERYLFYIACTRASERVYLSYPLADDGGKAMRRSHYVDEIEKLFDFPSTDRKDGYNFPLDRVLSTRDLYNLAADSFWDRCYDLEERAVRETAAAALFNSQAVANQELTDILTYRKRHNYKETPALSAKAIKQIQRDGGIYQMSVTSLERFARCPFSYFCARTLALAEPEIFDFGPRENGTAIHDTMQVLYNEVYKEKKIAKDDLRAIVQRGSVLYNNFVSQRFRKLQTMPMTKIIIDRDRKIFLEFLETEVKFQSSNGTTPTCFELSFQPGTRNSESADPSSSAKGLEVDCDDNIRAVLTGRIDRVDTFENEGNLFGIVIDYKSGTSPGPIKFEEGIDLQVPVYLHALDTLFDIKPAGGFYYYVKDIRKRGIYDKRFNDRISTKIKEKRTITDTYSNDGKTGEGLPDTINQTIETVKEYVRLIHNGDISVGDKNHQCTYCPYKGICRI